VVSDLAGLTGKVVKRSVSTTSKRAISNEEVAQTLANLLNGVAGGKCQPFGDIPASKRTSNRQPSTSPRVSLSVCPFLDLFLAASTPRSTVSLGETQLKRFSLTRTSRRSLLDPVQRRNPPRRCALPCQEPPEWTPWPGSWATHYRRSARWSSRWIALSAAAHLPRLSMPFFLLFFICRLEAPSNIRPTQSNVY
jgi:hypothetical protein